MRDAVVAEAAVFEPEEAKVLAAAYRLVVDRLSPDRLDHERDDEIAKLVHNLGRSRVRLKKPLQTSKHAGEVAAEAVEHLSYLAQAPADVRTAVYETGAAQRCGARIVGTFPNEFRQPPVSRL